MTESTCPLCHNPKPAKYKFCSKVCSNRNRNLTSNSLEAAQKHFLSKVVIPEDPSACWPWLGSLSKKGYGNFKYQGQMWHAHRVAWLLFVGEIPDGMHVLHDPIHCTSPSCTNYPRHLRLGTNDENVQDKFIAGHQPMGMSHYKAKVTEDMVRQIRYERNVLGKTCVEIGRKFGVSEKAISSISLHQRWKHVP